MDAGTLRIAVLLLGAVSALCVGGIVILESAGHTAPTFLATLASTSLGAIAGLLSQRPGEPPLNGRDP